MEGIMHRLNDDAQAILDTARDAHNPTDRDRRRLKGAMAVQLGAAAMVSSTTVGAAASAAAASTTAAAGGVGSALIGAGLMTKALAAMALVGAVTAGVAVHRRGAPMRNPVVNFSTAIEASSPSLPRAVAPEIAKSPAPEIASTAAPATASAAAPASTAVPVVAPRAKSRLDIGGPSRQREPTPLLEATSNADTLAREVSVLGSARAALRDHEPARALALLDANRATFAQGMLREEFLAARIFALRDLGRAVEADAAAAQFAAEMPHSPLAGESQPDRHSNDTHEN
jgi:hypothetical protein